MLQFLKILLIFLSSCHGFQQFKSSFNALKLFSTTNDIIYPSPPKIPYASIYRQNEICNVLTHNWEFGNCNHNTIFEATDEICHIRFSKDLLAFGMRNGRCCLIEISSGEILDKFYQHTGPVTAVDFDGVNMISGGSDGITNIYALTFNSPNQFGVCKYRFGLHSKSITAVRISKQNPSLSTSSSTKDDMIMVSCGADKKFVVVNMHR